MNTTDRTDVPDAHGVLPASYHDQYVGTMSYEDSFAKCFNLEWVLRIIEAVWGRVPPFSLLDSGSASGLTLGEFTAAGVDAWGVENSPAMVARTPPAVRHRNVLGDVRALPFADGAFDFTYDTTLCYLARGDLDAAARELHRVTRTGLFFGGVTADMTPEVIRENDLLKGVQSPLTLPEWADVFLRAGWKPAVTSPEVVEHLWVVESEVEVDDDYWYESPQSMALCFWSK